MPHNTGQHVSVAIDPSTGVTYVSYYDATHGDLRMAHYVGSGGNCGPSGSWHCQTVDSDGDVGQYSSIAVWEGKIKIAYHDATHGSLKYALASYGPTGSWWIQNVDKETPPINTGLYASLGLAYNGSSYISYYSDDPTGVDALRIADFVGSGGNCGYGTTAGMWRCETVDTGEGVGQHTSLAVVGSYAYRHIAYYDRGNGDLWYATNHGGTNCGPGGNTWTCYPVTGSTADVGQYASLYMDDEDHFHIAYYDATADTLKYAVDVGGGGNCGVLGSAQCDEIDAMMQGYNPLGVSVAEDAAGYPIIAYQSQYGSLNVARPLAAVGLPAGGGNCGPENLFYTWYCETIDRYGMWTPYRNGDYVSIAVGPSGLSTIAYYRVFTTSSDGNLMVSQQRLQAFLPLVMKT
jgi:hypothetical protein